VRNRLFSQNKSGKREYFILLYCLFLDEKYLARYMLLNTCNMSGSVVHVCYYSESYEIKESNLNVGTVAHKGWSKECRCLPLH
jgi:hypothetical protein